MNVVLDSLPPEGRSVTASFDDAWLVEAVRGAVDAKPRAVSTQLQVNKEAGDRFRVTGTLAARWQAHCDRCVRLLDVAFEGSVDLLYQRGRMADAEEVDLSTEELDIGWIEGGSIDLAAVVSEQVVLWLPDRVLCAEEHTTRVDTADTGACEVPVHDGGPDLRKKSAFSALANWKPSH